MSAPYSTPISSAGDTGLTGTVVAAVDGSPASLAALRATAALAAALGLPLEVVYVEDINVLRLGDLPFAREVGAYTASVRLLESAGLERELRTLAQRVERAAAAAAATHRLTWRFVLRRGAVADELAAAAAHAHLLGVGRVGRLAHGLGSIPLRLLAQTPAPLLIAPARTQMANGLSLPLTLLETGSPAAERTWGMVLRLLRALANAGNADRALRIIALREATGVARTHADQAATLGLGAEVITVNPAAARMLLQQTPGPVLLPADALAGSPFTTDALPPGPVIVVP